MMEISDYKQTKDNYQSNLNIKSYKELIAPEIQTEIKKLENEQEDTINPSVTLASFCFMFQTLIMRQWTIYWRNPMKFRGMLANSIISLIIVGLIFLSVISDNRPNDTGVYEVKSLFKYFIGAQGVCFVSITSSIMTGIFSVSLACNTYVIQFQASVKFTTKKQFLKSIVPFLIFWPR